MTSGGVWQYYRDDLNDNITEFELFKYKIKITGKAPTAGNIKDVNIVVSLRYLSNFWRTLEMLLINCEINLILTWYDDCVSYAELDQQNLKQQIQNFMLLL